MNLTLDNKVALITGGSRGIGAAAVKLFVAAGAKVIFNYQSAKAQAECLVAECGAQNCRALQSELSTTEAAQQLVSSAISNFGRLDIPSPTTASGRPKMPPSIAYPTNNGIERLP